MGLFLAEIVRERHLCRLVQLLLHKKPHSHRDTFAHLFADQEFGVLLKDTLTSCVKEAGIKQTVFELPD